VFVHGPGAQVQQGIAYLHRVRWNFFSTMEMPILAGRALAASDDRNSPKVAVVNESFARAYFGTPVAVGSRFSMGTPDGAPFDIVGVVRDARYTGQRDAVPQTLYIPHLQAGPTQMNFALRTAGAPAALVPSVRAAIREVDPSLPIFEVRTQVDVADQRLSPERRLAWLSSGSGLLALLLTCLALYGTLSYNVSRRTPEIGIRMALGAQRAQVIGSVLREALTLVAVGLVLGLLAAQASAWLVADQLFGITAGASGVRFAATVVLLAVATLAAFIPARRASRIDPLVALASE
jgi:predicted permease